MVEVSLPGQEGKPISFKVHSVPELSIGVAVNDAEEIGKVFPHIVKTYVSLPTGALHILLGSDNILYSTAHAQRAGKERRVDSV